MEGGADLHAHSLCSDGALPPAEVVTRAAAAGLAALALTDHDGVGGLAEAAATATQHRLRLIPGIEISCRADGTDVHLLAWFVDPEHAELRRVLAGLAAARARRLRLILAALTIAGAPLTEGAVRDRQPGEVVGRPHVADALVTAGFARDRDDAFRRWLRRGRPGFVPLERLAARDAIALVHAAGGVCGVAHAGLGVGDDCLAALASGGLDALEVGHPDHSPAQRRHYLDLAARLGLVTTSGSDFHGPEHGRAPLGGERMPAEALTALEARRR